jgi:tetratricopeptide (TPR) repeat protein
MVTYLGGHPDRTSQTPLLSVVVDRRSITVRRQFGRQFLTFSWADLRGLDVRPSMGGSDMLGGTALRLETDRGLSQLHVGALRPVQLRGMLAAWVVDEAGPGRPFPAAPPPAAQEVAGQLDAVRVSLDIWRAASLGREPLYDRGSLFYRMAVADNHRRIGHLAEAIAVLGPLAAEAAQAFGSADADTLTVHNELGQTYLAAGVVDAGLELLSEALAVAERSQGIDGDLTLVIRNNLAAGYQQAGQYAQAIDLHEENIRQTERRRGPADLVTVGRRNNLAATLGLAGQRERAIDMYWEVLDALADVDEHSLAVTARHNLAMLHNPSWQP